MHIKRCLYMWFTKTMQLWMKFKTLGSPQRRGWRCKENHRAAPGTCILGTLYPYNSLRADNDSIGWRPSAAHTTIFVCTHFSVVWCRNWKEICSQWICYVTGMAVSVTCILPCVPGFSVVGASAQPRFGVVVRCILASIPPHSVIEYYW